MENQKKIEEFKRKLRLYPTGCNGWHQSLFLRCPNCGDALKFGVLLNPKSEKVFYHCFHASCRAKGFWRLDSDVSGFGVFYDPGYDYLDSEEVTKEGREFLPLLSEPFYELPLYRINARPIAFRQPYLDKRGWTMDDYERIDVYKVTGKYCGEDRYLFPLKQDGKVVATISRSLMSKEWHYNFVKMTMAQKGSACPRYINSRSDFTRIVGGIDDARFKEHVIIVEGLFDKMNVDRFLRYNKEETTGCVFLNGTSMTQNQINLIKSRGAEYISLMLDYGVDPIRLKKNVDLITRSGLACSLIKIPSRFKKYDPGDMPFELMRTLLFEQSDYMRRKGKTIFTDVSGLGYFHQK